MFSQLATQCKLLRNIFYNTEQDDWYSGQKQEFYLVTPFKR